MWAEGVHSHRSEMDRLKVKQVAAATGLVVEQVKVPLPCLYFSLVTTTRDVFENVEVSDASFCVAYHNLSLFCPLFVFYFTCF